MSVEAERALLGAVVSGAVRNLDDLHVSGKDFYQPRDEAVWNAARAVQAAGDRIEIVGVLAELRKGEAPNLFRDRDPGLYLIDLSQSCPLPSAAPAYAKQVAEAADRRRLVEIADRIRGMAEEGVETDEIRSRSLADIQDLPRREGGVGRGWGDLDPEVIDLIERGTRRGIPTPWPDLNRIITGLVGSRLYVVGGRPGEGKSLIGMALALHACVQRRKPVLFASLEMSGVELGVRVYANYSSVPLTTLLAGEANPSHWELISEAQQRLAGMGLTINDRADLTVAAIKSAAEAIPNIGMVVVDYLTLVKPSRRAGSRREEVDEISRELKLLAKSLDVPVVALAQLNRQVTQRADRKPTLADLRESGAIEADADVVWLLSLDRDTSLLTLEVAKNRHGPTGHVDLNMWGHYARLQQPDGKWAA